MGLIRPLLRASFIAVATACFTAALQPRVSSAATAETSGSAADSTAEPRYYLDPVVVTGERLPLPLGRVPLDVTVLGRGRLDAHRQFLLADALREVPALDIQRTGGLGKLSDVRLRGADTRHTLVLFDGIPLNGPWLGSFDFADLMDPGVERVEVLGGPASSLYGSGAVGGVIQVLSFAASGGEGGDSGSRAGRDRLRAFAEYGENVTLRQGIQWNGAVGRAPLGIAATRLTSDGAGPRDGYRGLNGNFHMELPVGAKDRVRVSGLATDGKKELPYDFFFDFTDPTLSPFGSNKQVHDPNNDEQDRLFAGIATWRHTLLPAVELEAEASGLTGRIQNQNEPNGGGATDFLDTDLKNTRGIGALRARLHHGSLLQAVAGADYRGDQVKRDDAFNFGGFTDTTRVEKGIHARSLFAQAHWEGAGRLLADAGIRLDDHSRYGSYGVPRVALGLLAPEVGLKFRAGYGRAFTAPTLTDLYYPGYSNSTLRPERSTTWEAGAVGLWLDGRVEGRASYHHTNFIDLIQGVLQPDFSFLPENVGKARIEGEEYALHLAPHRRFEISGYAAHVIAKNTETGAPLAKRPSWRFGLSGQASVHRDLTLTGAWRWVDSVLDPFNFVDARGRVLDGDTPGYASLDLGALVTLRHWAPLELNARVSNVLDRDYSEVKGFPARGRAATVGVTFAP
jgi:vitamin B12 transporter